jgi:hypothetical protein
MILTTFQTSFQIPALQRYHSDNGQDSDTPRSHFRHGRRHVECKTIDMNTHATDGSHSRKDT